MRRTLILVLTVLAPALAGPDSRIDRLKAALESSDPKARAKAVSAIGNDAHVEKSRHDGALGEWAQEAVPLLIRALGDADDQVSAQAGSALGQIGPMARSAVPALIERARNGKRWVKSGAISGLGGIGKDAAAAVPVLLPYLREKDGDFQLATATALGAIGPDAKEAVPDLLKEYGRCLEAGPAASYSAATYARALGGIGPDAAPAIPILSPHALDKDIDLRRGALSALAGIGGKGMPDVLKALAYKGPDLGNASSATDIRWDAAIALAGSGTRDPGALSAVTATLTADKEGAVVKKEAVWVLIHAGKAALPALKQVLKQGADPCIAGAVHQALRDLGEKD